MPPESYELHPETTKIAGFLLAGSVVIVAVISGGFIALESAGALNVFFDLLKDFGINISASTIFFGVVLIAIALAAMLFLLNLAHVSNCSAILASDKIVVTTPNMFILKTTIEIPYLNITNITEEKTGLLASLSGNHHIRLDLTGVSQRVAQIRYVPNAAQVVAWIQNTVNTRRGQTSESSMEAQYTGNKAEAQKIQEILGREERY